MKTNLTPVLIRLAVLGAISVSPLVAATNAASPKAYAIGVVELDGTTIIRPGDTRTKVMARLGAPDQYLSPDTWVYRRFEPAPDQAGTKDCAVLLVSFGQGRVSRLEKVSEPAFATMVARLQAPKSTHRMVVEK